MKEAEAGAELKGYLAPAYYLAFGLALLVSSQLRPYYNWDLIAYVAAAKRIDTSDPVQIHRFAYEELRRSVPPGTYTQRVSGNEYQAAVSSDPQVLAEQLRFYRFRPIYVWAVYGLYRGGLDIVFASHLVSGIAVVLGVGLLYALGRRRLARPFLYALPILAVALGLLQIARLSTPDALAFLGVVAAAYLFLEMRPGLVVLAPALIAVRTDLILFTLPLLLYLLLRTGGRRRVAVALAIVVAVFLTWYLPVRYGNPGWLTTFYFWFMERSHVLAGASVSPTLDQYLWALVRGIWQAANDGAFVLHIVIAGWTLALIRARGMFEGWDRLLDSRPAALALICIGYVAAHFVLYPEPVARFFVAEYTLTTLVLFAFLSERGLPTLWGPAAR